MGFQVMLYLLLTYDFDCLDVPEVEKRGTRGGGGGSWEVHHATLNSVDHPSKGRWEKVSRLSLDLGDGTGAKRYWISVYVSE